MKLKYYKHFSFVLVLLQLITPTIAQTLTDGPIQFQIRVREINTLVSSSDGSALGVGFAPDDFTYLVWARDNADLDGASWQGGQCLQSNFDPPAPSQDLNTVIFNHTYPGANVPEFFDIRIDAWEDDLPTDNLAGICNSGSRCAYNCCNQCCGVVVFGSCVGLEEEDDDRCDANPHRTSLTYRQGSPCRWFSHGYVTGVCSSYQPRIETYWRYTRGETCNNPLPLGQLNVGGNLTHFNSNECYGNDYGDPGNDVFYSFTVTQPMGVRISLCGAIWNTTLYLLDANCNLLYQNLDAANCPPQSEINENLCSAGTYYVVVDGSTSVEQGLFNLVIAEDPASGLNANVTKTDVVCNGQSNGSATANVSGGTPPYTYLWTPGGQTTPAISNIPVGNYSVRVTDFRGCVVNEAVTITQPNLLGMTATVTDPVCNGSSDGMISVPLASGGVVPYEYSVGGSFQPSSLFTGLVAGNYTVTTRDANLCIATANVTLTDPPQIQANTSSTPVSCAGFDDGTIIVAPTLGTPAYFCSLGFPVVFTLCTGTYRNIAPGSYVLTVRDANGCEVTELVAVDLVPALTINLFSKTDLSCNNSADGTFEVVSTGGTSPIEYSINGGVNFQSSPIFTGLDADLYNVLVQDAQGCQNSLTVQVDEPSPLIPSVLFQIPVTCNGQGDGFMVITASGGSGPYFYSLDSVNFYQSGAFDNLTGGPYRFYVRDDNDCVATLDVIMLEPDTVTVSVVSSANASCDGINDGTFTLGATGGTPPFKFSLNNGPFQTNATFNGLAPGDYLLGVEDRSGCLAFDSASLGSNVLLGISVTKTDVLCNGNNTGEINIAGSSGVAPYTYSINNIIFQPSGTFSNLTAGNYTAIARDVNGCRAVEAVTVTQPPALTATIDSIRDASCPGIPEGAIFITPQGGDSIYTFNWSNTAVTEDIVNVIGGNYFVTITDGNNCFIVLAPRIDQPAPAFTDITRIDDVTCNGEADGYVDMDIAGGVPPFQYNWSNNTTNQDLLNVSGGTYYVTITDDSGCVKFDTASVIEPAVITSSIVATQVSCATSADGDVDLTVSGGTPPYDFFWSNFIFTEDLTNVPAATYTVRISDDNGCSTTNSVTISTAPGLTATLNITDLTCFGSDDGSVEIIVNGGTPPYVYDWSNNETTSVISNLAPGIYDVAVVDAIACSGNFSALVDEPQELKVNVSSTNVLCNGDNTGIAIPFVTGGTGSYTFLWSTNPPDSSAAQTSLSGGAYVLEVRDENDCIATAIVDVSQPPALAIDVLGTNDVLCIDGDDGEVTVRATGGVAPYQYSVFANRFQNDSVFIGLEAGDYGVMVLDDNGCMSTNAFTLLESPGFEVNLPPYIFISLGASDTLKPEVTSPLPIIGYYWSPPDYLSCTDCPNPVVVNPAQETSYTLEVTDSNGCIATNEITVVVKTEYEVFIPNAFTPNGDGNNDVLTPIDFGAVRTATFQIFNRWGALVYETTDINKGWDGTKGGKEQMPAVFVYYIQGEFLNGEAFDKTGSITLLK